MRLLKRSTCARMRVRREIRQSEGEALADLALYHEMTFSWEHIPQAQKLGEEALGIAQEIGDERVVARSLSAYPNRPDRLYVI